MNAPADSARAQAVLTEDYRELTAWAFTANDAPLFSNNLRLEFTQLYQRILLLAPQKMKRRSRDGRIPPLPL